MKIMISLLIYLILDIVEKEPFCGTENKSVVAHMNELSTMSALFSDDFKMRKYFVSKIFPFSLKGESRAWFNRLPPGSIDSLDCLIASFFQKYFPLSARHAALQRLFDFKQGEEEKFPESWTRFCALIHAHPGCPLPKNELVDIYYNGLTDDSRTYLDSFADCVFRKRTPTDAEELMTKISNNYDDWTSTELNTPEPITLEPVIPEPVPTPTTKKRGVIALNDEVMKEDKKCLKEKGIRAGDVKNLPPIEELCKPIPHSSTIEVHSLQFNEGDIPYGKPHDQCLEELDTFIVKQGNFNNQVQNHLLENSRAIHELKDIVEITSNDIKMLCKHFPMVQTQLDQLAKVQKDMLVNASGNKHAYGIRTRSGIATQYPLYPEGHPKRIEQDSQQGEYSGSPRKKKKNN